MLEMKTKVEFLPPEKPTRIKVSCRICHAEYQNTKLKGEIEDIGLERRRIVQRYAARKKAHPDEFCKC